jgi:hypothetical protein
MVCVGFRGGCEKYRLGALLDDKSANGGWQVGSRYQEAPIQPRKLQSLFT